MELTPVENVSYAKVLKKEKSKIKIDSSKPVENGSKNVASSYYDVSKESSDSEKPSTSDISSSKPSISSESTPKLNDLNLNEDSNSDNQDDREKRRREAMAKIASKLKQAYNEGVLVPPKKSKWGEFLKTINIKKILKAETFKITIQQLARDGDYSTMHYILSQMPKPQARVKINTSKDEDGATALHLAARYNHYDTCKLLLELGANPNCIKNDRSTPLHSAARFRRKSDDNKKSIESFEEGADPFSKFLSKTHEEGTVIELLCRHGADVNSADFEGQTPLHHACIKGNQENALQLMNCDQVMVEAKDIQGMTPLHYAITHAHVGIVWSLVIRGSDVTSCDNDLTTSLHFASSEGNLQIVKLILKQNISNNITTRNMLIRPDAGRNTCLHSAAQKGRRAVVEELILAASRCMDKKYFINISRAHGETALHLCASQGYVDVARILIENGADIQQRDNNFSTPMHLSARYNNFEVMELLVEKGAKSEDRDKDNLTALLLASTFGHVPTISWLIEHGANIEVSDKHEKNALMLAVQEQKIYAVQELLKHDLVTKLLQETDHTGNTVLHIAARIGHLPIVRELLKHGARLDSKNEDEETPLHVAAVNGRYMALKELLDHNNDMINAADENSNTALHLSALEGQTKCIKALIEYGGYVTLRNSKQMTPLDCACSRGWTSTVTELLKAKAPANPPKGSKTTPLHEACLNGHTAIVKLLLDWKADVRIVNMSGKNPMDCAIDAGNDECVEALLTHETWQSTLRNAYIDPLTGHLTTPTRKLIVKMPDMAALAFSNCITDNRKPLDHSELEVMMNFEYLDDMYNVNEWIKRNDDEEEHTFEDKAEHVYENIHVKDSKKSDKIMLQIPEDPLGYIAFNDEGRLNKDAITYTKDTGILRFNHPLMIMVSNKRENLLQHPVVTSLLQYKWKKYGGMVYYFSLFFLILCTAMINVYMIMMPPPYTVDYVKSLANRRFYQQFSPQKIVDYMAPRTCYSLLDKGVDYRGFSFKTISGKTCVPWDLTNTNKQLYPDAGLDKNYCRNPASRRDKPWCFYEYSETDVNARKTEECEVEHCKVFAVPLDTDYFPLGTECHFPFELDNKNYTTCVEDYGNKFCSVTTYLDWNEDATRGICSENPFCDGVEDGLKKVCGTAGIKKRNCEARGCCHKTHEAGKPNEWSECFHKLTNCSDLDIYCENDAEMGWCDELETRKRCPLSCGLCEVEKPPMDPEEDQFLYLMSVYSDGTFDVQWESGCYYLVPGAEKRFGSGCKFIGKWEEPTRIFLMLLCFFHLMRLLLQVWTYKLDCLHPIFCVEVILYVLCFLMVVDVGGLDITYAKAMEAEKSIYDELATKFQAETGIRLNWQWRCGAMSLFLSWLDLLLYIQKLPYLGIYVVMFNDVFKTFMKFSPVFLLFVFSFSTTLHILLQNQVAFEFPIGSIFKVIVMMVGELDFSGIFLSKNGYHTIVNYEYITYIVIMSFVFVMMIIIMNLLVGLAVGDIMAVQEHATLERLKMQVELALEVEFSVPNFFRKKFVRKVQSIYPNRYRSSNALKKAVMQNKQLSTKNIVNAINPEKTDVEEMKDTVNQLTHEVKDLKNKIVEQDNLMKEHIAMAKENNESQNGILKDILKSMEHRKSEENEDKNFFDCSEEEENSSTHGFNKNSKKFKYIKSKSRNIRRPRKK